MGLPPLSPWLQLGEGLHRHAFYTYVRDRTMRPRLGALSLTAAVLAAMMVDRSWTARSTPSAIATIRRRNFYTRSY